MSDTAVQKANEFYTKTIRNIKNNYFFNFISDINEFLSCSNAMEEDNRINKIINIFETICRAEKFQIPYSRHVFSLMIRFHMELSTLGLDAYRQILTQLYELSNKSSFNYMLLSSPLHVSYLDDYNVDIRKFIKCAYIYMSLIYECKTQHHIHAITLKDDFDVDIASIIHRLANFYPPEEEAEILNAIDNFIHTDKNSSMAICEEDAISDTVAFHIAEPVVLGNMRQWYSYFKILKRLGYRMTLIHEVTNIDEQLYNHIFDNFIFISNTLSYPTASRMARERFRTVFYCTPNSPWNLVLSAMGLGINQVGRGKYMTEHWDFNEYHEVHGFGTLSVLDVETSGTSVSNKNIVFCPWSFDDIDNVSCQFLQTYYNEHDKPTILFFSSQRYCQSKSIILDKYDFDYVFLCGNIKQYMAFIEDAITVTPNKFVPNLIVDAVNRNGRIIVQGEMNSRLYWELKRVNVEVYTTQLEMRIRQWLTENLHMEKHKITKVKHTTPRDDLDKPSS